MTKRLLVMREKQSKTAMDDKGFHEALDGVFDLLAEKMRRQGNAEAADAALFGGVETLINSYQPGETETKK